MEYLLDTHTFLWFINGDVQLSKHAREAIGNPDAIKYVSIASFWEIAIKVNLGKLSLDMPYIDLHHRDPFDRIIIAQALNERLILISKDGNFEKYGQLRMLW